ncbi:MAG: nucleoside phosphorylase [Rudaea sp.]
MEFHIRCDPQDISRYCFTPGDHARARKIAAHFERARLVSESRGYLVLSGYFGGAFMTVCATGMGGPTVAIALEELGHMGADTFIRVGSCGVLQPGLTVGDVVISIGAVRGGGTANAYLPPSFPAVPSFEVTRALVDAAADRGIAVHVGVSSSGDAFYAPSRGQDLREGNVLAVEMEADTLFIVGQYRGWRTGALFASDGTSTEIKPAWGEEAFRRGEENAIRIALEAMRGIAKKDAGQEGKDESLLAGEGANG